MNFSIIALVQGEKKGLLPLQEKSQHYLYLPPYYEVFHLQN